MPLPPLRQLGAGPLQFAIWSRNMRPGNISASGLLQTRHLHRTLLHAPHRPASLASSIPAPTLIPPATRPLFTSRKPRRSPALRRLRNFTASFTILAGLFAGYTLATDSRSSIHTYVVPPFLRIIFPGPSSAEAAHAFGVSALARFYSLHTPLHDRTFGVPQNKIPFLPSGGIDWALAQSTGLLNPYGLAIHLFGHPLTTPLGIPAGLDKHAECIDALFALTPAIGIVEIGCVTPRPQPGNPGTRVWRLAGTQGMLNRYGFNSVGCEEVARRLRERVRKWALERHVTEEDVLNGLLPSPPSSTTNQELQRPLPASLIPGRLLAIQIGKNATTPPDDLPKVVSDYITCVQILGPYADLLVVNVSSPNTPGLRTLQSRTPLTTILNAVVDAAERVPRRVKPKVLVKVSPDEDSAEQIRDICAAVRDAGVSGIIAANTTTKRDAKLLPEFGISDEEARVVREEAGGVSGPVLYPRMVKLVARYRTELDKMGLWERFDGVENGGDDSDDGESGGGGVQTKMERYWGRARRGDQSGVVVIGCGGVGSGEQAVEAMRKGAGGVWLYTGMVYGGVGTMGRVMQEMRKIVRGE